MSTRKIRRKSSIDSPDFFDARGTLSLYTLDTCKISSSAIVRSLQVRGAPPLTIPRQADRGITLERFIAHR